MMDDTSSKAVGMSFGFMGIILFMWWLELASHEINGTDPTETMIMYAAFAAVTIVSGAVFAVRGILHSRRAAQ